MIEGRFLSYIARDYHDHAERDISKATRDRTQGAKAISLESINDVVEESDCILSIVPPRDAIATAERVKDASSEARARRKRKLLYYIDLNAISPSRALEIEKLFDPKDVRFIDGGVSDTHEYLKTKTILIQR